jgi:mevalonate kinase
MALKVIAEAPGKIIITGEHFVVHGAYALAAAIDRKVTVEARRADKLIIESDRLRLSKHLSPLAHVMRLIYDERDERPRIHLRIHSQIPDGSGLGSSASTMVASIAAASRLEGWGLDTNSIIKYAMAGERKIHGRPSGVDVQVTTLGGVILFKMEEEPRRIELTKPLRMIVANSGKKRRTREIIGKVNSIKQKYPHLFSALCDSANLLSELASKKLINREVEELGKILILNHSLLSRVGASSAMLDELVNLCLSLGCYGAKLTGAGGGGSVIALAKEETTHLILSRLANKFDSFIGALPCKGVRSWTQS